MNCFIYKAIRSSKNLFVGREVQLTELRNIFNSVHPEFVGVDGRRRVGKPLLIKEAANYNFTFTFTAPQNMTKSQQLANFALEVARQFNYPGTFSFKTCFEAFTKLNHLLEELPYNKNKIIFG